MFKKITLIGRLGQHAKAKTAHNNREYVTLGLATRKAGRTIRATTRPAPS